MITNSMAWINFAPIVDKIKAFKWHVVIYLDPETVADFAPISLIASTPLMLVVNASLPVNNIRELIAHAKARPGSINYGTPGTGTPGTAQPDQPGQPPANKPNLHCAP